MSLRPPRNLAQRAAATDNPLAGLEHEMMQEAAASMGALGRQLTAALAALEAFDPAAGSAAERAALVDAAGALLWRYIVQREAAGLRNSESVMRDMRVPPAVRLRMGVMPRGGTPL
jgi:hypothetical protein